MICLLALGHDWRTSTWILYKEIEKIHNLKEKKYKYANDLHHSTSVLDWKLCELSISNPRWLQHTAYFLNGLGDGMEGSGRQLNRQLGLRRLKKDAVPSLGATEG
ncbi:unnamed protein product [Lepeophtheirus salmonis]|uniref:(salmon louse) hypothetical protein n=1 Tax=Lepeophtheirus salmonis TaxID=72036 RepID=A0A7R8D3H2_LEPSM|nr:unnamed protein product [Lepeophtheirus salmonis]CAF3016462.1 unnamed protein product [Lepeophtheirus salmonis]